VELSEDNSKAQRSKDFSANKDNKAKNVQPHRTLLAHCLHNHNKDRVQDAMEMAEATWITNVPDPLTHDDDNQ
jgi:hypothetical protein